MYEPQRLDEVMDLVLSRIGVAAARHLDRLSTDWDTLATVPWSGRTRPLSLQDGHLVFSAVKSPKLLGEMRHLEGNRFVVRWIDRSLEADAYVLFETDRNDNVTGISMSRMDDGDYDFEDLKLKRVE